MSWQLNASEKAPEEPRYSLELGLDSSGSHPERWSCIYTCKECKLDTRSEKEEEEVGESPEKPLTGVEGGWWDPAHRLPK